MALVALTAAVPHLDRPFDYLVPTSLDADVVPGCRVAVRFGGKDAEGFVLERRATSSHDGRLQPLRRVLTPFGVLTPATIALVEAVARDHGAGFADVVRFAVPPRHVATEKPYRALFSATGGTSDGTGEVPVGAEPGVGDWVSYRGGTAFLRRVAEGESPRAVWSVLPGVGERGWAHQIAIAALRTMAAGRGSVVVVPDVYDVDAVLEALEELRPGVTAQAEGALAPTAVRYTHDLGVGPRYGAFLAALSGQARIVVGTRPAAYVPMPELGLLVCWEDADSSHAEPRAPYARTLDVLVARAEIEHVALLVGSHARSVAAQGLVESGWAREVLADRDVVRARAARVEVAGDDFSRTRDPGALSRVPGLALAALRQGLADGLPVLVQVPRLGYLPGLACQECRRSARCEHCHGPLQRASADGIVTCGWCARPAPAWRCPTCRATRLRNTTVGVGRTAEELGRTFPQVPVVTSWSEHRLQRVDPTPALVLATPGAEPLCENGYGAAALLDAQLLVGRPRLDADENALRRWMGALSLVRPAREGGRVVLLVDPGLPVVQALVRHDAPWLARRLWAEREALRLPPATVFARIVGEPALVAGWARDVEWPPDAVLLGPTPVDASSHPDQGAGRAADALDVPALVRLTVSVDRAHRRDLAAALRAAVVKASLERRPIPRVQVGADPDL